MINVRTFLYEYSHTRYFNYYLNSIFFTHLDVPFSRQSNHKFNLIAKEVDYFSSFILLFIILYRSHKTQFLHATALPTSSTLMYRIHFLQDWWFVRQWVGSIFQWRSEKSQHDGQDVLAGGRAIPSFFC